MFHGFRDVLAELGLTQATIAIEKNFFDAALYEVFTAHILPKARVVPAAPIVSQLRMLKDAAEIECLKAAGKVADEGMSAALHGKPGVGAGGVVARYEWFGPYDSEGAARVIKLSPQRFDTRPKIFGITIGEFRHEWGASAQGATYTVESVIGVDWPLVGPRVNALLRRFVFSEGMLREWKRHQVQEVGLLPHFLPQLYAQRNDSNIYRLP